MSTDPVEEIRARVDIVEVISAHVRLVQAGRTFKGLCPFHREKTPSFTVNPDSGFWHCFGCQEGGDVFSFVMKTEGLSFPEALERLADKAGVTLERRGPRADLGEKEAMLQALSASSRFFEQCLARDERAKAYLAGRQIDPKTLGEFQIGFAPLSWNSLTNFLSKEKVDLEAAAKAGLVGRRRDGGYYDRFRYRIMFPVKDTSDRLVGFGGRDLGQEGPKYLNSPESPVFHKGSILYGLSMARKAISAQGFAILVEGYLDVISPYRAGLENVVAVMGTAFGQGHAALLKRFCDRVVVCLDSDSAGRKAALNASGVLEAEGFDVRVASLPVGEDPDSLVTSGRSGELREAVEKAASASEYRLNHLMSGFRLSEETERVRMLAKAVPLLAKTPNVFEQDRLIKKLAAYHPGFSTSPEQAESRIRQEVDKLARPVGRGRTSPASVPARPATAPRRPIGALEKAERILLKGLIDGGQTADRIAQRIRAEDFVSEPARMLAEELLTRIALGENDPAVTAVMVSRDGAGDGRVARLLSALMTGSNDPPITEEVIGDCIGRLEKENRKLSLQELKEKLQRRDLGRNDPEYQRFYSLQQQEKHA